VNPNTFSSALLLVLEGYYTPKSKARFESPAKENSHLKLRNSSKINEKFLMIV